MEKKAQVYELTAADEIPQRDSKPKVEITPLARQLLKSEGDRKENELYLRSVLAKRQEEDDRTPFWMWMLLWFVMGILFDISATNLGMHFYKMTTGG